VLRRQAHGDESEREAWPRATAGTTAARATRQRNERKRKRGLHRTMAKPANCAGFALQQPPNAVPERARGRAARPPRPPAVIANSLANRACFTYALATQHEDCGPCVQIAVNAALDDGMDPQAIRAVLDRNHEQMPARVSLVVRFAEGVLARNGSEDGVRNEIETQLGATVLTELSLAIACARVFPTLKRGLGFARSCALVKVVVEPRR